MNQKLLNKIFAKFILASTYIDYLALRLKGNIHDEKLKVKLNTVLVSTNSLSNAIKRELSESKEDELYDDATALDMVLELSIAAEKSNRAFEFKNDIYKLQAKYLKNK